MESNSPVKLTSSLAKVLHYFCNGFVEFMGHAHLTGILCLITEDGQSVRFSVDEKVFRLDDNCVKINSKSFNINVFEEEVLPSSSVNKEAIETSNKVPDQYGISSDSFTAETRLTQVDFLETIGNDASENSTEQTSDGKSPDTLQVTGTCSSNNEVNQSFHFDLKDENSDIKIRDIKTCSGDCVFTTGVQDSSFDSSGEKFYFKKKAYCDKDFDLILFSYAQT